MILGLNGGLNSGKDTTFRIIQELYPEAVRISFAEKVKESLSLATGMSRELLDELKNKEGVKIAIIGLMGGNISSKNFKEAANWSINVRELMQNYGDQAHRELFGESFWVDQALPFNIDHKQKLLVVTDMRYSNEINRVKFLGGVTAKIIREVETNHSDHPSEQNLDSYIDHFINNTSDLDHLRKEVQHLLATIGVIR